jgi:hypothetical protein
MSAFLISKLQVKKDMSFSTFSLTFLQFHKSVQKQVLCTNGKCLAFCVEKKTSKRAETRLELTLIVTTSSLKRVSIIVGVVALELPTLRAIQICSSHAAQYVLCGYKAPIHALYGITGLSRYIGCPTMPNNRLDPTSILLVQDHIHLCCIHT